MAEKQQVITLCQQLIQARSYSGEEKEAAEVLKAFFTENHFDEVRTDACGNAIGIIKGKRPGPCIVFDGHMDTVPVNEGDWSVPPFGGIIKDGRIYGRGTSDMKGPIAAMACAALSFADETERDFPGTIVVAGIVFEELFEGPASRYIGEHYRPDFVVIGEASNLNLKIGQRGRAEIVLETFGTSAHSAHPEKGNNAILAMWKAADVINRLPVPTGDHPVMNRGTLVLTDVRSEPYPGTSCVPWYCRATYDRRTMVGETRESVLQPIQEALDALQASDATFQYRLSYATGEAVCYTGETLRAEKFFPAWCYDEKEPAVQACLAELRADGFDPAITIYDFCTNGSYYAGEEGIMTIGLGPSDEELAHTVDEYIEIDQLTAAVSCYKALMRALLK